MWKYLENGFLKKNLISKCCHLSSSDICKSSSCHSWLKKWKFGPLLTQFWVKTSSPHVSETNLLIQNIINIYYPFWFFLSLFKQNIQIWAIFPHFRDNDVTKVINDSKYLNTNQRKWFSALKTHKTYISEVGFVDGNILL